MSLRSIALDQRIALAAALALALAGCARKKEEPAVEAPAAAPAAAAVESLEGQVDIVAWRGESSDAALALALPDFSRYRRMAEKIEWLQPAAHFAYYWVHENGTVEIT